MPTKYFILKAIVKAISGWLKRRRQYQIRWENSVPGRAKALREVRKKAAKAFYAKNRISQKKKIHQWQVDNRDRVRQNARLMRKLRQRTDIQYRAMCSIRVRFKQFIRGERLSKFLGANRLDVIKHIESLWKKGMNWANYGINGWHIDHIIPISRFDLTRLEQVEKCFHFTNLQPLWASENIAKGNRVYA